MIKSLLYTFAQTKVEQRKNCTGEETGTNCLSTIPKVAANEAELQKGLAILFGAIAAITVLVIILGAISYVTAEGNPEAISKAKKTIIYALIGLMVALSAEVIVLTVVGRL